MGKSIRRLIHRYLGCPLRGIQYQVNPQVAQRLGMTQVRGYGISCDGCDRFWHGDSPTFHAWGAAREHSPRLAFRRL
jgi:hypothetical protein